MFRFLSSSNHANWHGSDWQNYRSCVPSPCRHRGGPCIKQTRKALQLQLETALRNLWSMPCRINSEPSPESAQNQPFCETILPIHMERRHFCKYLKVFWSRDVREPQ